MRSIGWRCTRLAIEDVDGFELDEREIIRAGPSYTIDTLESFPRDEELSLILGADAALGIEDLASLRGDPGSGVHPCRAAPRYRPPGRQAALPDAVFLDMAVLEVSGTEIGEMAQLGEPFRFLVARPVYHYILDHGLYADMGEDDRVGGSSDQEDVS